MPPDAFRWLFQQNAAPVQQNAVPVQQNVAPMQRNGARVPQNGDPVPLLAFSAQPSPRF